MGALMRGRRSATLAAALLLLTECVSAAPPSVDRSHAFMEPAQPKPRSPRLKSPYGGGTDGHSGVMVSLSRLVTPQRTLIMLPAVWAAMVMLRPDLLARLLLQLICYLGSLFEPFDGLLPQHGLLRVRQPAASTPRPPGLASRSLTWMPPPGSTLVSADVGQHCEGRQARVQCQARHSIH